MSETKLIYQSVTLEVEVFSLFTRICYYMQKFSNARVAIFAKLSGTVGGMTYEKKWQIHSGDIS
jgi:hypothetical protein